MAVYGPAIVLRVPGPSVSPAVNSDLREALARLGPADHLPQKASRRCRVRG